jgi:hypothetical protein
MLVKELGEWRTDFPSKRLKFWRRRRHLHHRQESMLAAEFPIALWLASRLSRCPSMMTIIL